MRYSDIVGQEETIGQLRTFGNLYAGSGTVPDSVLMLGDDGMGKRTIAAAFANENGMSVEEVDAFSVEARADLTAVLTNLKQRQVLALANIHRLPSAFQELLWGAARDRKMEIVIGQGPSARRHTLGVHAFTLVATAPKKSDCSPNLLAIFPLVLSLQPHSRLDLQSICGKVAAQISLAIDLASCELVAANCQGRPRQIELLLQRLARAVNRKSITERDTSSRLLKN